MREGGKREGAPGGAPWGWDDGWGVIVAVVVVTTCFCDVYLIYTREGGKREGAPGGAPWGWDDGWGLFVVVVVVVVVRLALVGKFDVTREDGFVAGGVGAVDHQVIGAGSGILRDDYVVVVDVGVLTRDFP